MRSYAVINCSLSNSHFPHGFLNCLKQENKKINTFIPDIPEDCMFHITTVATFLALVLTLWHHSRHSAASEEKALYVVFLIAAKQSI